MGAFRASHAVAALAILAGALLALFPPAAMSAEMARATGLGIATVGLLATAALPEHVTAILFFLFAVLFAVAPPEIIFAGFHSSAFWLVFGGLIIGLGVRRTGLAERLAYAIARSLGTSYAAIIGGMVAIGVVLAFLMPSTMARVLLLLPIVMAMAEGFGFEHGSKGRAGMVLAASFGTMLPAFTILPAALPAVIMAGTSETLYGIAPVYGDFLLLHFPVLGFLKAVTIAVVIVLLFPDTPTISNKSAEKPQPMQRDERIMSLLLALALALWVTDFLHHVSPAWVALGVASILLLPAVGLVPAQAFSEKVNYGSLFYVAGVLGLGALLNYSGTGELLARAALDVVALEPGDTAKTFGFVAGLGALIAMVATQPAVPIIMTPLSQTIADAAALPIETVLMMQVVGFSTVVLPYQTPPLVVAMQVGNVPMSQGNKLCLAVLAVTVFLLIPLDFVWWWVLGRFG